MLKHHHTKACRKIGDKCRFNYPKFPSTKTILSIPVGKINDYASAEEESEEVPAEAEDQGDGEPQEESIEVPVEAIPEQSKPAVDEL